MILIKKLTIGILFSTFLTQPGIYDLSVPKIEGGNLSLSELQNKKILVVTLPLQQNAAADSMLYALDTLAAAHSNLSVIGVPSFEDGYTLNAKTQLTAWYRSKLGSYVTITDGLYIRKSSSSQHALFKWLTHIDQNESFDIDAAATGYKFFIKPGGELYSVMVPQTALSSNAVQKTLQIQ